jgi:hypothetical protein
MSINRKTDNQESEELFDPRKVQIDRSLQPPKKRSYSSGSNGRQKNKEPKDYGKLGIALAVVLAAVLLFVDVTAYFNQKKADDARDAAKEKALASLNLTFNKESATIEYSMGDPIDALTLVTADNGNRTDDNLKVTAKPSAIDPKTVGKTAIKYTVSDTDSDGEEIDKDYKFTAQVVDTTLPVIQVNYESYVITAGDEFNPADMITSVADPVDGALGLVDQVPADTSTGYYTIASNLDTETAGTYTITVTAVDNHGNTATKDVGVQVNAARVYSAPAEEEATPTPEAGNQTDTTAEQANQDTQAQ